MSLNRRDFIKTSLLSSGVFMAGLALPSWASSAIAASNDGASLSLLPPDENGFLLPKGFSSKILARTGEKVPGSDYIWHRAPDGGAVFPMKDGGWVYVSNAETPDTGGVGALRFDARGNVKDAYPILSGTQWNCAGGAMPWGTWLSCEEHPFGQVWECDPEGKKQAQVMPALGTFKHEAAAVDPKTNILYLTEDVPDGLFYRFIPDQTNIGGRPSLEKGSLQALAKSGDDLVWKDIPKVHLGEYEPTRYQIENPLTFNGGEGCVYKNGIIYFSTKGDNKIWAFDIRAMRVSTLYDFNNSPTPILSGVDNLAVNPNGDISVAEDGGNMELVGLTSKGLAYAMFRLSGQDESEITGPAFSPDGKYLYFSSQRGFTGTHDGGITYQITGPFKDI